MNSCSFVHYYGSRTWPIHSSHARSPLSRQSSSSVQGRVRRWRIAAAAVANLDSPMSWGSFARCDYVQYHSYDLMYKRIFRCQWCNVSSWGLWVTTANVTII